MTSTHTGIGRRVALVVNPSADLYGSDRMMLETVRGLRERGWTVVVATSQHGPLVPELLAAGAAVEVCPAPVVRRSNLSPKGMLQLGREVLRGLPAMVRLVRRVKPDVIYVNTVTIPFWLLVARLLGAPSAIHVHEAEASASAVARFGLTVPTRLADRVICNSATSLEVAARSGGRRSRMQVVPNGVAGPDTVAPPRESVPDPRLVFVGRLSPRKGVDIAVRALAALRADGSPVRPVSDHRPARWSGSGADGRKGRTPPAHAKSTVHLHLGRPDQDEVAIEVATGATAITFNPVAALSFAPFAF